MHRAAVRKRAAATDLEAAAQNSSCSLQRASLQRITMRQRSGAAKHRMAQQSSALQRGRKVIASYVWSDHILISARIPNDEVFVSMADGSAVKLNKYGQTPQLLPDGIDDQVRVAVAVADIIDRPSDKLAGSHAEMVHLSLDQLKRMLQMSGKVTAGSGECDEGEDALESRMCSAELTQTQPPRSFESWRRPQYSDLELDIPQGAKGLTVGMHGRQWLSSNVHMKHFKWVGPALAAVVFAIASGYTVPVRLVQNGYLSPMAWVRGEAGGYNPRLTDAVFQLNANVLSNMGTSEEAQQHAELREQRRAQGRRRIKTCLFAILASVLAMLLAQQLKSLWVFSAALVLGTVSYMNGGQAAFDAEVCAGQKLDVWQPWCNSWC